MQTNGFADEERIIEAIEAGGKDISISPTAWPALQDRINGGFNKSWHQALKAISVFSKYLPKETSFILGRGLRTDNIGDVEDVIRFGTEIYGSPRWCRCMSATMQTRWALEPLMLLSELMLLNMTR